MAISTSTKTATGAPYTTGVPPATTPPTTPPVAGLSVRLPQTPTTFRGLARNYYDPAELHDEEGLDESGDGSSEEEINSRVIDGLPLPKWAKTRLKKWLGYSGNGDGSLPLPTSAKAAKLISEFQSQHSIKLLSIEQMQEMADTGYCTLPGRTVQVPPEVQAAALKFMANNAELFKRLESAVTGDYDGLISRADYLEILTNGSMGKLERSAHLPTYYGVCSDDFFKHLMTGNISNTRPSEYAAARAINQFQKQHDIKLLSFKQMKQMADTGYCKMPAGKIMLVPPEVQDAAAKFMENNAELFKKVESAITGQYDGMLNPADYTAAVMNIKISLKGLPSAVASGKFVTEFMKQNNIGLLSKDQVREMAKGRVTLPNGQVILVPTQARVGAKRLMADEGALFDELEAGVTGQKDGMLGQLDYDAAMKKGFGNGLPSAADATESIYGFITQNNIDKLSKGQMQEIADTGKCTLPDGQVITVPLQVQQAARKFMENGGFLFDRIESADDGNKDGILGARDGFVAAISKGLVPLPSADAAASGINDFLKRNNIDLLNKDQMTNLAQTGQVTVKGQVIKGTPQDQLAAMKLMENDGEQFDQLEAANTGKRDGWVGRLDYYAGRREGVFGR